MEKIKVLFATSNPGKLRELIVIFSDLFGREFDVSGQAPKNCEETGIDFLENAKIKADCLAQELMGQSRANQKTWIIADDSGLCVAALNGKPGIHSARYAGDHVAPDAHMKKLLLELGKTQQSRPWKAHYHCALFLHILEGNGISKSFSGEGQCYGEIVPEAKGQSGFGYDPLFLFSESGLRFSELADSEKNQKSHRMAAFVALKGQMGGTFS
jgi:XTP/dITP diphosphohydrolase